MVTTATPWRQQRGADWEGREGKVALEREAHGRYGKGTFGTRECRKHQRMCSGGGWRWRELGGRGEKKNRRSGVRQQRVRLQPRADLGIKFQINKKKQKKCPCWAARPTSGVVASARLLFKKKKNGMADLVLKCAGDSLYVASVSSPTLEVVYWSHLMCQTVCVGELMQRKQRNPSLLI